MVKQVIVIFRATARIAAQTGPWNPRGPRPEPSAALGSRGVKAIRRFTVRTSLPESISALSRLAANLRWSWHRPTEQLFRDLGPEAWEASGGDPVQVLGSLTREEIQQIAEDGELVRRIDALGRDLETYLSEPLWYQREHGRDGARSIAYFSAEFGITEVLPQYSGGLGILAGFLWAALEGPLLF